MLLWALGGCTQLPEPSNAQMVAAEEAALSACLELPTAAEAEACGELVMRAFDLRWVKATGSTER